MVIVETNFRLVG